MLCARSFDSGSRAIYNEGTHPRLTGAWHSMIPESVQTYWHNFLAELPQDSPYHGAAFIYEGWGDGTPAMADELGGLIAAGVKTATCSALWEWQAEGGALPAAGLITVVLDGRGQPLCIVETCEVRQCRYDEVDAAFAYDEGEGDRSLAYWRAAHQRFFSRTLPKIGRAFAEDMPLVCERFRLIYRHGPAGAHYLDPVQQPTAD
jgi:uncharacterized protein YhfF